MQPVARIMRHEPHAGAREAAIVNRRAPWLWAGPALLAVALIGLMLGCPALSPGAPPRLESDSAWDPGKFTSLEPRARREIERYSEIGEYGHARLDPRFVFRRWTYRSDSLNVVAFACRRKEEADSRPRRPAVVFCRGSWVQDGLSAAMLPVLHRLAEAGFVAVAPQYRGSEGGEGRDEMGGRDVRDVTALVEILARDPGVDPRAIYLYGESRGGMMAYQAARDGARVRALATVGAFTDLDSIFRSDPRSAAMAGRIWPDWATRRKQIAERRSVMRWAEKIRVPTLILFGRQDEQVDPAQGQRLARALERNGVPAKYVVVENAGHVIGQRSMMRDSLVVDWFRRWKP